MSQQQAQPTNAPVQHEQQPDVQEEKTSWWKATLGLWLGRLSIFPILIGAIYLMDALLQGEEAGLAIIGFAIIATGWLLLGLVLLFAAFYLRY